MELQRATEIFKTRISYRTFEIFSRSIVESFSIHRRWTVMRHTNGDNTLLRCRFITYHRWCGCIAENNSFLPTTWLLTLQYLISPTTKQHGIHQMPSAPITKAGSNQCSSIEIYTKMSMWDYRGDETSFAPETIHSTAFQSSLILWLVDSIMNWLTFASLGWFGYSKKFWKYLKACIYYRNLIKTLLFNISTTYYFC